MATVRTGERAGSRSSALPGPNRFLRFRYAGTPTIRGTTSVVELRIRAASSIRGQPPARGQRRGRHVPRPRQGQPIPATGKLLQLQVYSRGSWLTFATPRANARGRWRHRYRFTATRGVTRYRFRVRLPRESRLSVRCRLVAISRRQGHWPLAATFGMLHVSRLHDGGGGSTVLKRLRSHASYANIVATLALVRGDRRHVVRRDSAASQQRRRAGRSSPRAVGASRDSGGRP